jgi:hypothetical protein
LKTCANITDKESFREKKVFSLFSIEILSTEKYLTKPIEFLSIKELKLIDSKIFKESFTFGWRIKVH